MAEIKLLSPVVGVVWEVEATVGANLEDDETVLVIESMKMELPVVAPQAAELKQVLVAKGDSVEEGQVLAILETD